MLDFPKLKEMAMAADRIEVNTLILRFRDLVTSPGDTVARHQEIAKEKGHVWWGWWNKAGETVPDDVFRELSKSAKSANGLSLLLLDSGNARLYWAICREILWSNDHERIPSPGATPDYYKDQTYLTWFRFSEISPPVGESTLQNYSYVQVNPFFEDGESRYTPFSGKRIYSIHE